MQLYPIDTRYSENLNQSHTKCLVFFYLLKIQYLLSLKFVIIFINRLRITLYNGAAQSAAALLATATTVSSHVERYILVLDKETKKVIVVTHFVVQ